VRCSRTGPILVVERSVVTGSRTPWSRRRVLAAGVSWLGATACSSLPSSRYSGLRSARWLGPARTLVALDGERPFTEGPAVAPNQDVYFTEMRSSRILRYSPGTGSLSVFREQSNRANGLEFDGSGRLVVCEEATGRITRLDPLGTAAEVLVESYGDARIGNVNDLALDREGRIYFTSRPANLDPTQGNVSALYRLDPDGGIARLLAFPAVQMPNGLAISRDQATLYLVDSNGSAGGRRVIEAYRLSRRGELSHRRLVYDFGLGRGGDGMCLDRQGNLYVAAGLHATRKSTAETLDILPGIHVFSPGGRLLAYCRTPEDTVTNCAFGHGASAHTLYVTCGRRLLAIDTEAGGA
jgi:gluconolactonase